MNINLRRLALFSLLFAACGNEDGPKDNLNTDTVVAPSVNIPEFNADSAYNYVAKQVAFGPRVPGTVAQEKCAAWMQMMLQQYCDTVYRQAPTLTAGDGVTKLPCINLIGSINPQATNRILLLAHWDSRPWADADQKNKDQPILGADDGGSGVGVLLELARQLHANPISTDLGIDILLTDVEDYGKTEWGDQSYALGTQYWANTPHLRGYKARFGILLDMVGAANARFPLEGVSKSYAPDVQQKVWNAAGRGGYSSYFTYDLGGSIDDDHVPINKVLGIPTIDIIHLPTFSSNGMFPSHWHTHADNMDVIDRQTLKAVGQTLLRVLYEEAAIPAPST